MKRTALTGGYIGLASLLCVGGEAKALPARADAPFLRDVVTDKARYAPHTRVTFTISLQNATRIVLSGAVVKIVCKSLGVPVPGPAPQTFTLNPGRVTRLAIGWDPPAADYHGYSVEVNVIDQYGVLLEKRDTAVDVSSSWLRFPRYGYLTRYGAQSAEDSAAVIAQLNAFHLNALQFYDWQYKHHQPLAGTVAQPSASWQELASTPSRPKINARQTVLDLIEASHTRAIAAMNYNLLYGAWKGYAAEGVDPKWGLWKKPDGTDQDALSLPTDWQTNTIYLFNPCNSEWQNYLLAQEANVFAAYPFDGWQVDQVGDRGTVYDTAGNRIDLPQSFAPFLTTARRKLDRTIVFNSVGGYGLEESVRDSPEDVAYVECWEANGQKTYLDLQRMLERSERASQGHKATVLAAYMDYAFAKTHVGGIFNLPGLLLTDAVIFASGGAHIELGDDSQMLCSEYFPNRSLQLEPTAQRMLRGYYDFLVAYENLLRGGGKPSTGLLTLDRATSLDAAPKTIWAFSKQVGDYQALHLINLMGESSTQWRDENADRPVPTPQTNITVKTYTNVKKLKRVFWASPDFENGRAQVLPYKMGADGRGKFVQVVVPRLAYWDMVVLQQ